MRAYRPYTDRAGLMRCGAQLGKISVGPGSQLTCTNICRIRRGSQLGAIGSIGLRPVPCTDCTMLAAFFSLMKAGTVCSQLMEDSVFTADGENKKRLFAFKGSCHLIDGVS